LFRPAGQPIVDIRPALTYSCAGVRSQFPAHDSTGAEPTGSVRASSWSWRDQAAAQGRFRGTTTNARSDGVSVNRRGPGPLRRQVAALDRGRHHPARRRQGWRDLGRRQREPVLAAEEARGEAARRFRERAARPDRGGLVRRRAHRRRARVKVLGAPVGAVCAWASATGGSGKNGAPRPRRPVPRRHTRARTACGGGEDASTPCRHRLSARLSRLPPRSAGTRSARRAPHRGPAAAAPPNHRRDARRSTLAARSGWRGRRGGSGRAPRHLRRDREGRSNTAARSARVTSRRSPPRIRSQVAQACARCQASALVSSASSCSAWMRSSAKARTVVDSGRPRRCASRVRPRRAGADKFTLTGPAGARRRPAPRDEVFIVEYTTRLWSQARSRAASRSCMSNRPTGRPCSSTTGN
jgi:hypothetical protein